MNEVNKSKQTLNMYSFDRVNTVLIAVQCDRENGIGKIDKINQRAHVSFNQITDTTDIRNKMSHLLSTITINSTYVKSVAINPDR